MSSFKLHSEDSEFNNRVDALFNSLQTAAVVLEPEEEEALQSPTQSQTKRTFDEGPNAADEDSEEHSGTIGHKFRRPAGLPPQWRGSGRGARSFGPRNSTPDYVKNPEKWTRYSMKDVKVSSDRENKKIGLDLFAELRSRQEEEGQAEDEDSCSKITFKKPAKPEVTEKEEDRVSVPETSADAIFGGTKKFRMTEYEVGQSKSKRKSKPKKAKVCDAVEGEEAKNKKDTIRLDYLTFEEDDDGDE